MANVLLNSGCGGRVMHRNSLPYPPVGRFSHAGCVIEGIETASAKHDGLLPAGTLRSLGVRPKTMAAMVNRRELKCVRRGIYVDGNRWLEAKPDERYRLFLRATALASPPRGPASHLSAAALHQLPLIGTWPGTLHALNVEASGGSSARFVTTHRGPAPAAVVQIGEFLVTSLARTLIDVAASSSFLVAVTMIDHALRVESERANEARRAGRACSVLTKDELYEELVAVNPRRGAKQAERAIAFANPLAANPGESLSRVRIVELGFEVPELQVSFPNIDGNDYVVDFFWRRIRKIGEFDGMLKYTRGAVLGNRDPAEVVVAEKLREDALRRHVNSFGRWVWDTAISPRKFYDFLLAEGVPRA